MSNGLFKWRYVQRLPDGTVWTSDQVFEGEQVRAVQGVIAGFLIGQPRAAIEEGTGRRMYALDGKGRQVSTFDGRTQPA